ncbi:MAG TPA: YidB family protein [Pseudoduganella sp.]
MGIFDTLAGQVLGQLSGEGNQGVYEALGGMLTNPQTGGLQGLVEAFQQGGLGHLVQSWVGTGENLPISAEQLQAVLGSERLQAIAASIGLDPQQVAAQLAQLLPQVVDRLTPNGAIPDSRGALDSLFGNRG